MKKQYNIITLTTGGTGGHVFPSFAISEYILNNTDYKINLLIDKRGLRYDIPWSKKVKVSTIMVRGSQHNSLLDKIKKIIYLFLGFLQSMYFLIKDRPKVIISFGGYASVPAVVSAIILHIPIIMHEQNSIIGRSHKFFLKFVKVLATSFETTLINGQPIAKSGINYKLVGNPVRSFTFPKIKARDNNFFTIAVLGGSQGAQIFSKNIPQAISLLSTEDQKRIFVYHQCRKEYISETTTLWKKNLANFIIKPFFNNIYEIIEESDVVITRGGASTIAEINTVGKYAIYVPYELAADNHQKFNALNAKEQSGADIILEKEFTVETIARTITSLLNREINIKARAELAKNSAKTKATEDLANLIINTIK